MQFNLKFCNFGIYAELPGFMFHPSRYNPISAAIQINFAGWMNLEKSDLLLSRKPVLGLGARYGWISGTSWIAISNQLVLSCATHTMSIAAAPGSAWKKKILSRVIQMSWPLFLFSGLTKDHIYRMVIVEGRCTMARSSSLGANCSLVDTKV